MRKKRFLPGALLLSGVLFSAATMAQKQVTLSIQPDAVHKPISPYIYGTNDFYSQAAAMRLGGNRLTSYNWENNASNAGHDWIQHSDDWLPWHFGVPDSDYNKPASTIVHYHNQALQQQAYSLITLPMAGYVAKDKNGTVSVGDAAPSSRWAKVQARKNGPLSLQPDLTDNTIYVEEELNFLLNKFGQSNTATGIKAYSLDNEPCLWSSSHELLWGNRRAGTTVQNLMDKSIELAALIKEKDPGAEVYGPALYGFTAYQNLQFASDWEQVKQTGDYNYFIEYYLAKMRKEEQRLGKRLLDVLDLHWYPEGNADYGNVSPFNDRNDRNSVAARLQMTRSLWDSTYYENTWIGREHHDGILPLLPKLKGIISNRYPGTKLALTEYSYMGLGHISGAIAEADALGIFGQQGLYMATYWGDVSGYVKAGFDVFRNYDGNGNAFGNNSVAATSTDRTNAAIYAAVQDNDLSKLHAVAINKNMDSAIVATIQVSGTHIYKSARVWLLDNKGTQMRQVKDVRVINGNSFEYRLPPMTIAHFVLTDEDLSVYPFFDTVTASAATGYSDGNATLAINARVLDGDHNLSKVTVDLSAVGGNTEAPMSLSGDQYSIQYTIPANTPSGMKAITLAATDASGHVIKETIYYRVIRKLAPAVIWDGDHVAGGEGYTFYDGSDSHAAALKIEKVNTGGNKQPGALAMHFEHDVNLWNLFSWRFDANPANAKDISEYGFLEFYIKTNAPKEADLEISLRDASENMSVSNTILLKAQGYISSFSNQHYAKVRIPVTALTAGTDLDLTRVWQINIGCNRAVNGLDVWMDDITATPYTNLPVQPHFTRVNVTPDATYADGSTAVTIQAVAADPDNNIHTVTADLSALDLPADQVLTNTNGVYSATFTIPQSVTSGDKMIRFSVADDDYNQADSAVAFKVLPQATTDVVWDGDHISGGHFIYVNDELTSHSIDNVGGHSEPVVMKMHLEHTWENPFCAVFADWNEDAVNPRKVDFSKKRYLNFYLKTTTVSPDFDLMLIVKDHYATEARTIWLKQEGYISEYTGEYQLVKIPVAELAANGEADMEHIARLGFLTVRAVGGVDVFVDDITLSGSPVADVSFQVQGAGCANGSILVDRIANASGTFSYYLDGNANPSGMHNPLFSGLAAGSYAVKVSNEHGFTYQETITVPTLVPLSIAGTTDTSGSIDLTVTGGSGNYTYYWSDGNVAEDRQHLANGNYQVTVTDDLNGCTAQQTFTVVRNSFTVSVYPNPATTFINVDFTTPQLAGPVQVTVSDKFGAAVASSTYTVSQGTAHLNLPPLMPGLYYVTVAAGGSVSTTSFFIQ